MGGVTAKPARTCDSRTSTTWEKSLISSWPSQVRRVREGTAASGKIPENFLPDSGLARVVERAREILTELLTSFHSSFTVVNSTDSPLELQQVLLPVKDHPGDSEFVSSLLNAPVPLLRHSIRRSLQLVKQARRESATPNISSHVFVVFNRTETTPYGVGGQPYFLGLSHVGSCKEIDNSQKCEGAPEADSPPGQAPLRITQEMNK